MGNRSCWEVADFFAEPQTGKRRTKKHGEKKLKGFLFLELILQKFRSCKGLIDEAVWALVFLELSESLFNPLIPTIRMLRNILPFGLEAKEWNSYRDENHSFCCLFRTSWSCFCFGINHTNSAETYHILWECLQNSCPSNQSSANWCDCPTENKIEGSFNLFTTNPTKIVNIISLHFSLLSKINGIYWNLILCYPVLFSHKKSHGTHLSLLC